MLVTGATGRLGPLLRTAFARGVADPVTPVFAARKLPADLLLDDDDTPPDLPTCKTVLALWGQTTGDASHLAQNTQLAHRSRALAIACGARRVLHLSSAAIYGPGADMDEAHIPAPDGAYGQAKLEMENTVAGFTTDCARHTCLRLANVVGADSLSPALRSDAPVGLDRFPDGTGPLRSYISPGDLARVINALAQLPPDDLPDLLNVAAPAPISMQALALAAGKDILWQTAPDRATQAVTLSTKRLASLLPGLILHTTAAQMIADWHSLRGPQ